MEEPMIGGLPADQWVGRMVFLRATAVSTEKRSTRFARMCPARVVAVNGNAVTVRPSGHRHDTVVHSDHIKPWWARNPDLRQPTAERP